MVALVLKQLGLLELKQMGLLLLKLRLNLAVFGRRKAYSNLGSEPSFFLFSLRNVEQQPHPSRAGIS